MSKADQVSKELILATPIGSRYAQVLSKRLEQAYDCIGYSFLVKNYPFKRALQEADSAKVDGLLGRLSLPNHYNNLIKINEPLFEVDVFLYKLAGQKTEISIKELPKYNVGIINGNQAGETIAGRLPSVIKVATGEQLMRMLAQKRIDVAIATRAGGEGYIKQCNLVGKVIKQEPPIKKMLFHHYLHKKHLHIADDITACLKAGK